MKLLPYALIIGGVAALVGLAGGYLTARWLNSRDARR